MQKGMQNRTNNNKKNNKEQHNRTYRLRNTEYIVLASLYPGHINYEHNDRKEF